LVLDNSSSRAKTVLSAEKSHVSPAAYGARPTGTQLPVVNHPETIHCNNVVGWYINKTPVSVRPVKWSRLATSLGALGPCWLEVSGPLTV
jgi:hypothetical protein